jgi:hypothetical protein
MVNSNKCKRDGKVESYKHLLVEGREAKNLEANNEYMVNIKHSTNNVLCYAEVFRIADVAFVSKVKVVKKVNKLKFCVVR